MTAHITMGEADRGRSCRTCAKWDGACADRRHSNTDPDRPCGLYRYRQAAAVEAADMRGDMRQCPRCHRLRPVADFTNRFGMECKSCAKCRADHNTTCRASRARQRARKDDKR